MVLARILPTVAGFSANQIPRTSEFAKARAFSDESDLGARLISLLISSEPAVHDHFFHYLSIVTAPQLRQRHLFHFSRATLSKRTFTCIVRSQAVTP